MKVLGIYGSPRKGGNSDLLLDEVLAAAGQAGAETERIYCRKLKKLSGCLECGGCDETGECVVKDDMQEVYPLLDAADAIVLAAPIFFYNMPAQAKALVDRAQARWAKRLLTKTKEERRSYDAGRGWLIGVGATKGANLFTGMELTAKYFYDALDMSYEGAMLVRGVEGKDGARNKPEFIQEARDLGRAIAES
ncbi:NADPH-dependent FMN reductase [Desulfocarbo indianensis]|nr:NADPH-dependent FMN reductase [Desulfocarbo indianensis]